MKLATCHPERKHKALGFCASCYDKELKRSSTGYRQRQLASTSKWLTELTPEKRRHLNASRSARWELQKGDTAHKDKRRSAQLFRKYGISLDDYELMLKSQNGGCKICTRRPGNRPLHVDHNHETGRVRGLLCHQCNWYLGTLEEDYSTVLRLISYLHEDAIKGVT
jgi:hypothetical protein